VFILHYQSQCYPYPTLFRSPLSAVDRREDARALPRAHQRGPADRDGRIELPRPASAVPCRLAGGIVTALQIILWVAVPYAAIAVDRKSTRLNSTHVKISYAV